MCHCCIIIIQNLKPFIKNGLQIGINWITRLSEPFRSQCLPEQVLLNNKNKNSDLGFELNWILPSVVHAALPSFILRYRSNTPLVILMHEYVTILFKNEAIGAGTASGGGLVPLVSLWVRMTPCINIKRGVYIRRHYLSSTGCAILDSVFPWVMQCRGAMLQDKLFARFLFYF